MDKSRIEAELSGMRIPELQAKFAEVTGETTKSPNRKFLVKRILAELESIAAIEKAAPGEAADARPATEGAAETGAETAAPKSIAEMKPVLGEAPADETTEEPEPAADEKPRRGRKPKNHAAPREGVDAGEDDGGAGEKLSKLSLDDLRARYHEVIGRPTKSTNRRYLVWKLQQAAKGRVRIGPRATGPRTDGAASRVIPLRIPAAAIQPLDEVRVRMGLRSRNELLTNSIFLFLMQAGERDAAGHFAVATDLAVDPE